MSEDKKEEKKNGKLMDNLFKLPIFKKLKNVKHIEIIVCIIFIALLLLIYFAEFGAEKSNSSSVTSTGSEIVAGETLYTSSTEYAKQIEEKLTLALSKLQGVGSVSVVVSVSSGGEVVVASNVEETTVENENGKNVTVVKTPIIVTENGTSKPLVLMEILPTINGVLVVAGGADDVNVKLNIYKALETLIDIPSENIQVFAGK